MPSERPQVLLINRAIVFNEDKKFLIIKRADKDSYKPGSWECPGGKLDKGQDLSRALERETMEETGLLVEPIERMVYIDSYLVGEGPYTGLPYVQIFSLARVIGGKLEISHEHSEHAWVDYETALSYKLTPETKKALIILKDRFV